ncbi:hypothetical protein [Streptomyces rochei]|uniref:hypothetical protein n=1 Tax=Streptomyces rochei TaxID=1928 RepID=UPI0033B496B7
MEVNPLYFAITDTNGTRHTFVLAADENQSDTVDLAPGENVSSTVTVKDPCTPQYVTFTDRGRGDLIRVNAS